MHGSDANQICPRSPRQAALLHALQQHIGRCPRARQSIGASHADFAFTQPGTFVTGCHFQQIWPLTALQAMHGNTILPAWRQMCLSNIQDHIWGDISRRIMQFIQKLFLDRALINNTASAFRFGDQQG